MDLAVLRDTDLGALADGAAAWRGYADALWNAEEGARRNLAAAVRGAEWKGEAAEQAAEVGDQMGDLFETRAMRADAMADALTQAHDQLVPLQRDLRTVISTVDTKYPDLAWRPDGTLFVPALDAGSTSGNWEGLAAEFNTAITAILTTAEQIGTSLATAITDLAPEQAGYVSRDEYTDLMRDSQDANDLLAPPDLGPERNADWWASLSEDEQQRYISTFPDVIGALDGLPTTDRDAANRLNLHRDIENGYDPDNAAALLEKIEESDHLPPMERYYLLGYTGPGPEGTPDAKVIVSVGNPDLAANTGVYVPGMTTDLSNVGGDIDRAAALRSGAEALAAPGSGVATIMWLGYDPPDAPTADPAHGLSGLSDDAAVSGAPALDAFINGLHTSHTGPPAHMTAVGHSYGSLLIGTAASSGDGVAVDDVVVVGSPGMGVDSADQLNMDPSHVWAGAANDDYVSAFGDEVHGQDPTSADFGGNRISVDTSGHSGYWEQGSQSLWNQSAVIAGMYDNVYSDTPREGGWIGRE